MIDVYDIQAPARKRKSVAVPLREQKDVKDTLNRLLKPPQTDSTIVGTGAGPSNPGPKPEEPAQIPPNVKIDRLTGLPLLPGQPARNLAKYGKSNLPSNLPARRPNDRNAIQIRGRSIILRREAWELYADGYTANYICEKLGITHTTFSGWRTRYDWPAKRELIAQELEDAHRFALTKCKAQHVTEITQRHVAVARTLDDAVKAKLEKKDDLNPRDLESLGKAFKSSADVASRAVGMTTQTEVRIQNGERPLNRCVGYVTKRTPRVIDITPDQ